jgi:hypothetical protein
MLRAVSFLACLVLLTTSLESHWSWINALNGAIVTHILIGQSYFSKAIGVCCLQAHARPKCVRACMTLAIIELSGSMFFGAFGTHLGVMLKQSFHDTHKIQ